MRCSLGGGGEGVGVSPGDDHGARPRPHEFVDECLGNVRCATENYDGLGLTKCVFHSAPIY